MNPTITYAITVHNEFLELTHLLEVIYPYLQHNDQVLIQSDSTSVTDEVLNVIEEFAHQYAGSDFRITHESIPLEKNFGKFKNHLKEKSSCDWIFQIDADEYPSESLLTSLLFVLKENVNVDVILVPRINTVSGITQRHVDTWKWKIQVMEHPLLKSHTSLTTGIDPDTISLLRSNGCVIREHDDTLYYYMPVINFPDYQWRLYKNIPEIKWMNKVHERLQGFANYAHLPAEISWCMFHHKEINRQVQQNLFYNTIH